MSKSTMMGGRRNRCRHGAVECTYGCCRALVTGSKSKTRRVIRTREKRAWKSDAQNS